MVMQITRTELPIHRLAGRGWRPIGHSGFTGHLTRAGRHSHDIPTGRLADPRAGLVVPGADVPEDHRSTPPQEARTGWPRGRAAGSGALPRSASGPAPRGGRGQGGGGVAVDEVGEPGE